MSILVMPIKPNHSLPGKLGLRGAYHAELEALAPCDSCSVSSRTA